MDVVTFLFGGCFFIAVNRLFITTLTTIFHNKLSLADRYFITEKCVSSLQAVLSMIIGVIIVQACQDNIMTSTHWLVKWYAWFGLPYFLYDVWAIYNTHYYLHEDVLLKMTTVKGIRHFIKFNIAMLIHHLMLPFIFFPSIMYFREDKGDYFVGIFYTIEAAIPFISVRFILKQLKMKDSTWYMVSGLLMIIVFFIVRVGVFPFLYWKYGIYAGIPFLEVPFRIPIKCNMGCFSIIILQIYFLYLMLRGAFKYFYTMYKDTKVK